MNVSQQNIDKVSAVIKIEITKADYQEKVDKALRAYRQKANIPGFRRGMVPMGMIQKMFGKSVLAEEFNKLVSESLFNYIRENKLNVLGEPMPVADQPEINFDGQEDFTVSFDVALAPEISVNLSKEDCVNYYNVTVDDTMVEKQCEALANRFGTQEPVEVAGEKDMIRGKFIELDEAGNVKDGGIVVESGIISPNYFKNEDEKSKFAGVKVGQKVIFNPAKSCDNNEVELASMLHIKKEEAANMKSDFEVEVTSILGFKPAEMGQELFDNAFGKDVVKTEEEYKFLASEVERLRHILESKENKEEIIKNELLEIKAKYNDKRKSEMALHLDLNIENEDLIPRDDVLITITRGGYAKRMKTSEYRSQSRGGVGITGIKTKENDIVEHVISTSTHDFLLFFTNLGRVYKLKGYQIPEGNRTSKGIPLVNMINFQDGEHLAAVTNISDIANQEQCIFFATKKGIIKRTSVSQFQNIRTNGINAINLTEGDELLQVEVTDGHREIILGASNGKAIRFNEETVREIGRSATGVRGMKLNEGDELVGMAVVRDDVKDILVVTEKGYGKRTDADEYRLQTRGGMGVKTLNITDKNGRLASLRAVNDDLDLIATTNKGVTIRMHCADISQTGRAAQGVKLIRLRDDQHVSSIAIVEREDDEVVQVESPVASQEVSVDSPQENIQAE